MRLSKWHRFSPLLMIVSVCLFATLLQAQLFVNWDVSWDLIGSQRMLAKGSSYLKDFFDMNPPLIIYLYAPAVFFAKLFHSTVMMGLNIYVFSLSLFSLSICYLFCNKIFLPADRTLALWFVTVIAMVFLVLPFYEWGQREHLLLILTMPYFLAITYRLQNNTLPFYYALGIGLMAAIGFSIKPYFLITLALVELYYIFSRQKIFAWARVEVIVVILFLAAYLVVIYRFYPDYLSIVVPFTLNFYYKSIQDPWADILINPGLWFCYFAIAYYIALYHKNSYRILSSVLLLACIGFLFSYFLQRTSWHYHIYPAYSIALLLFILLFGLTIREKKLRKLRVLLGILIFAFPLYHSIAIYSFGIEYKKNHASLINYMQNVVQNKSTYSLSAEGNQIFPAALSAKTNYVSRFMHLYWLPGLAKINADQTPLTLQQQNTEKAFTKMIVEDLTTKKPDYIFVDTKNVKPYFASIQFDHLAYFFKNPDFRNVFKHYVYINTIEKRSPVSLNKLMAWSLAVATKIENIDPKDISASVVVITGEGDTRRVYYIFQKKYVASKYKIFSITLTLTKEQQEFLASQKGLIKRTESNNNIINQIIERTTTTPAYSFQVYQHQNEKPQEKL